MGKLRHGAGTVAACARREEEPEQHDQTQPHNVGNDGTIPRRNSREIVIAFENACGLLFGDGAVKVGMEGFYVSDADFIVSRAVEFLAEVQGEGIAGEREGFYFLLRKQVEHVGIGQRRAAVGKQRACHGDENQNQHKKQKQQIDARLFRQ